MVTCAERGGVKGTGAAQDVETLAPFLEEGERGSVGVNVKTLHKQSHPPHIKGPLYLSPPHMHAHGHAGTHTYTHTHTP